MSDPKIRVVIVGGGIVGLVLASALAAAKLKVTVIEVKKPPLRWAKDSVDARVSAINLASVEILKQLGVWEALPSESVSPIERLRVWDHLGGGEIGFDCADCGVPSCGYIVENRAIVRALWIKISDHANIELYCPNRVEALWRGKDQLRVTLDDKQEINADLLVGADGGHSWVREQMTTNTHVRDYHQHALVCVVNSEKPHEHTAWQNFLPTGPIAYLPLAQPNQGAIVYSTSITEAQRLKALESHALGLELTNALEQRLGELSVVSPVQTLPLVMRHASDYVNPQLALVGDAAHTIHPLAGQGANLGLLDAACLAQVIIDGLKKGQAIGSLQVLNRYQRWRKSDNVMMQAAMTAFNQLFSNTMPWLVPMRSQGLDLADRAGIFKRWVMRYAMGTEGELPNLAHRTTTDS